jgi:peroxiredoxin
MKRLHTAVYSLLLSCALLPAADIPRPAPDYPIPLTNGQTLRTADFKGKVVVVEFLLTTCPGCQAAAGILSRMQAELGPEKLQVIGVAVNEGAERLVGAFIDMHAKNFPIGVRNIDSARAYLQIPIMTRLLFPQMAFIDKNGVIRSQHGGANDEAFFANEEKSIRDEIAKLLNEKGPAPAAKKSPAASAKR